jgi:hypothetical protein
MKTMRKRNDDIYIYIHINVDIYDTDKDVTKNILTKV